MISVIVPVYKVEKYLNRCVDSIINQTYCDLEIILVDDGSPDNCGKICDDYAKKDNRIKVIHKENGGLSDARNAGLNVATGDYIGFVDSDDYIKSDMYKNMISSIKDNDICMCGCEIIDEDGNLLSEDGFKNQIFLGADIVSNVVLPLKTSVWNKIFKREFIGDNKFPNGYIHGEDLVFLTNIINPDTKLVTIEYNGYNYIKHSNSITTSSFSKKSFDEVYCKDISADNISEKFPEYILESKTWCFRARLNLIRKILLSDELKYNDTLNEYFNWLKMQYHFLKKHLSLKTKFEYTILRFSKKLYKIIILIFRK